MKTKPNILYIMTDQQRFDNIGYANPHVRTPCLDRLASESVVFTNGYTANPSCVPARAGVYTGKFPSQCGAPSFITHLPDSEVTFMSRLQQLGYHTAVVGKQHFGDTTVERGYDYEMIVDAHMPFQSGIEIPPDQPTFNPYDQWLQQEGFTDRSQLMEPDQNNPYLTRWKVDQKYHIDNFVGERGRQWIGRSSSSEMPWFCCISFPGPHPPNDCINLPQAEQYDPGDIDMPRSTYEDLSEKPAHNALNHGDPPGLRRRANNDEIRQIRHAYYANMTLIDEKVGSILEALKTSGEYDNTMIIFNSDHGDYLGDFGMMYKAQNIFEVLLRVPFFIKPPIRDYPGKQESSFVSIIDTGPTCLSVAGGGIPSGCHGRDLSYYWDDLSDLDDQDELYLEARDIRCIRTRKWKLGFYSRRNYGELYDLESDPWERDNLWESEVHRSVKEELKDRLISKLIEISPRSWVPWNKGAPVI